MDMRPLPRVPNPYPLVFSSIVCFYGDANCQSLSPSFSQSKSTDLWRRDASVNRKCCSGTAVAIAVAAIAVAVAAASLAKSCKRVSNT